MTSKFITDEERVKCLQALRMVAMSGVLMKGTSLDSCIHKYSFITQLSLANCFVSTSEAINPNDKALQGLLMILGQEDNDPNWINIGALQSSLEDRLISFEHLRRNLGCFSFESSRRGQGRPL